MYKHITINSLDPQARAVPASTSGLVLRTRCLCRMSLHVSTGFRESYIDQIVNSAGHTTQDAGVVRLGAETEVAHLQFIIHLL